MIEFVCWREEDAWLGCLREFPDHWTQGETLDDLNAHLKDLHADLTEGGPDSRQGHRPHDR